MPKTYDVDWNGPAVKRIVFDATLAGINSTMGSCVRSAQENTPVLTGNLRRSIKIQDLAAEERNVISGLWGSADVNYALAIEAGLMSRTVNVQAHTRKLKSGKVQQVSAHTRNQTARPGVYMLRNAADQHYPSLRSRIASRVRNQLAKQSAGA